MTTKYRHGFPRFGEVTDASELLASGSLKSATDIPNAANASIGVDVEFDSENGARSLGQGADAVQQIFYDGPAAAVSAWSQDHVQVATDRGFMICFEVHRDAFDIGATGLAGTGKVTPIHFRGTANVGLLLFGRGGTAGNTIYASTLSTLMTGLTSVTGYCSQYANDKEFVPICLVYKRGRLNVYVDGYHASQYAATAWATNDFDDLRLVGGQYASSSTPTGFPYWMRNLEIINRRLILPINQYADRMTFIGDSLVATGDYYTGSPRENASHLGWRADAGLTPVAERILAREGIFTRDLHNSGEVGARLLYVATGKNVLSQLNGTPTSSHYDATTSRGKIACTIVGTNDAVSESTTVEELRTAFGVFITAIETAGFEQILFGNIPDVSGQTLVPTYTQVEQLARIQAINAMYAEEIALRSNVYLINLYTIAGAYDSSRFDADTLHPGAEMHAEFGRAFAYKALSLVKNWGYL